MKLINLLFMENCPYLKIIVSPFYILEVIIILKIITTLLNFDQVTKKQKYVFIFLYSLFLMVTKWMNLIFLRIGVNIFVLFILIRFVFKRTTYSSIVASLLPALIIVPIEITIIILLNRLNDITVRNLTIVPVYRILKILFVCSMSYLLCLFLKKKNFKLLSVDSLQKSAREILISNLLFGFAVIWSELILVYKYLSIIPIYFVFFNVSIDVAYFFLSFTNLNNTTKLEIVTRDNESLKNYNKTLGILEDSLRTFRHDFANILQAMGGYISKKDMEGLSIYYEELVDDFKKVNNLSSLNPEVINNPSVFSILASKYHKADEYGVKINLDIFMDLQQINMKIYDFTKIFGILLDNAIEASKDCDKKEINLSITFNKDKNLQVIKIENTYSNKDVDLGNIFEKGFSTKKNNTGLGLWEVKKIVDRTKNIFLRTNKNSEYFTQILEISKVY